VGGNYAVEVNIKTDVTGVEDRKVQSISYFGKKLSHVVAPAQPRSLGSLRELDAIHSMCESSDCAHE
jgi:hypothetical protein